MYVVSAQKNHLNVTARLSTQTGWPRTLGRRENKENGHKKSLQGKIAREFEKMMKIREKSGNLKKIY